MYSYYTAKDAIKAASIYGLENEVKSLIKQGFTPDDALAEVGDKVSIVLIEECSTSYEKITLSEEDINNINYLSLFNLEGDYMDYRRVGYDPIGAFEFVINSL